jgi:hypothetical protein
MMVASASDALCTLLIKYPACETFRTCVVLRRCTRVGFLMRFQRTVTERGRADECPSADHRKLCVVVVQSVGELSQRRERTANWGKARSLWPRQRRVG